MSEQEKLGDTGTAAPAPLAEAQRGAPSRVLEWGKLAFPLLVLCIYSLGQYFSGSGTYRGGKTEKEVGSLTGIDPSTPRERLTREGRELLADLEALAARDDWPGVRNRAGGAPAGLREHSAVKGFALLARTKTGEKGAVLERQIMALAPTLTRDGDFAALREQLDMAQARLIVDRSGTIELLLANAETLRRLVEGAPLRPSVLDTRIRIAQRFESIGAKRYQEAIDKTPDDQIGIREARGLFQSALRWIVAPEGWETLTPLSESLRPHTERILGRIQQANRALNPTDIPFTERDAGTWTGRKGDPIHDAPRK